MPDPADDPKRLDRKWAFALWLLLGSLAWALCLAKGLIISSDGTFYLKHAEEIINQTGPQASLISNIWNLPYLGFFLYLALIIRLSGENWPWVYLLVNSSLFALTAPALFLLSLRLAPTLPRGLAGLIAIVFPLANPDVLIFINYLLKDTVICGLHAMFHALVLLAVLDRRPRLLLGAALLGVCALLMRATSFLLFFEALILLAALWLKRSKGASWRTLTVLLLAGWLGVEALAAYLLLEVPSLPLGLDNFLASMKRLIQAGVVIVDQPEVNMHPSETFGGYFVFVLNKALHYFRYWNWNYSWPHQIFRHAYYLSLGGLSVWAFWRYVRENTPVSQDLKIVMFYTGVVLLVTCAMRSSMVLAYGFRYQLSIMLFPWLWALLALHGFMKPKALDQNPDLLESVS